MVKKFPLSNFKLWLFISALFTFSNAFSVNWYVNDNSTTGDVYCTSIGNNTNNGTSPSTPKLTLGAAITAASPGDTIFIDTGTYSGTGNINLTVSIANLTFTGAGSLKTIFDNNFASANTNYWLRIQANNINISGISATEFTSTTGPGKVITVSGQTVTLNDVIFFDNGNNGNGTLYIESNSNVTYANSSTTCNADQLFGGGIDLVGNNSVLNITNCILATNNKANNGDGGAVLIKGNGNNVTITNTRFEKNNAVNGGAICIYGGTTAGPNLVTIIGSCFENNLADQTSSAANGGAICIGRGESTINVTDCSFTNNQAGIGAASGRGGAISVNTGIVGGLSSLTGTAKLNLVRCNFSGNNATASGKHLYGDESIGQAEVTINQCTFASAGNFDIAQNTSTEVVFTVTNSGSPTVSNVTLTNTTAPTQTAATVCQAFTGDGCTLPTPCTASLSYPNSSICSSASTQTPTISPTGGTFTSTSGLTINASTGVITPSTSTAGTYTITYTPNSADPNCTATFSITIVAQPNAGTNGALTICAGTTVTATQLFAQLGGSPASGGTWSPALAGAGTYTYTVAATSPCTIAATATVTVLDSQPAQPTTACYQTATFNTTTCSWDVTGTQPVQPTTACYQTATFNTTTCSWDVTGTQPAQPTTACYQIATFNTTTCSWDVTGTQPVQPTTACYQTATFNTTTCSWDVTGTQPVQPTTACYQTATFNTTTCSWDVTGTQPAQPTTACYQIATFNTTTCSWDVTGTQPVQPTTACYQTATFNTTTCAWDVTGTQPAQPTTACYQTATFNTTTCAWDVTGTQPVQPTTACYQTATFNTTTCSWDVTGTQPVQPTTACYQTATFNTTTCSWDVTGTQPAQPTTACYQIATFNTTTCSWDVTGTQPVQPTTACYQTATFNTTTCSWDITGTQPAQPTTACYQTATFNTTTCAWVLTGTQPAQPTTACYQTATFNTTTCSWDVTGTQPVQPTTACYQTATFNTTTCSWDITGTQPVQPTTACYQTATFNTTTCSWVLTGTQPAQPTTACYQTATFNTTTCSWDVTGTQPAQPTATNCWDDYQFNTTSCTWVNNGSQPTQPTATNCWDNYQFNTTSCTWVNNGSQPTQPTATNCWDNYQFNPTICSWVNNGSQPTQPTATNCWDNYQFNTTSCTWVNNGSQPTQPTATNCWDNYQFNTITCTWVNNGSQPTQPTATNCWDNYQFNTTICSWVNNGTQPTQPTATNCWDNYQFNTTSCTWVNNGTQPTQPLLTVNSAICNGTSYSVSFNSSGNVTASSGTISGNTVSGIAVGTNVVLTASSSSACTATTTVAVTSPANCTNPPTDCIMPTLSAGQGTCAGTGTYSFSFNASVGAVVSISSGTISGNAVTGIALGTNVTLTATNGSCVTSLVVNSPTDCSIPCATPVVSFSAGICNGTTYSINISNPNNATITTSAGTVTATAITGIPIGTSVTITSSISGCSPQIITISSPLIPVNPNAGNDGSIEICDGEVPTNAELFSALGGNPQLGGSWSNSGNIYTYTVMASSSCASLPLDRATVTVTTIIINDFEIVGHCNDSRYQLTINPVQSDAVYTWYNGIGDLVGTGNSMYINASDTYEVTSSKSICSKVRSIFIENIHCIIPKGVSPNGDGLNDTWDLSNMNVEKAQIFNRYGMEMYSKSNYTDEWHGQTNDGQMLPSATYYYVLRFLDGTSKTGWVYLNREQ